ncbi:MAG: crossover junction endodeoxyribonuclease RuvC [Rikenellaceae bacterium]|nr:crossover junction endodeoxyribonuclease RuvC [Rikenellaceae bacterium]MCL2692900.1 crossover junction endodeoxyribonuclease RuvC [Rikenellaceae bacterium]
MPHETKIIMGIDPGTNATGYGVLEVCGRTVRCVVLGYIELHKVEDVYQKLRHIFERVNALIAEYRPDEVALESPFFGENVQSMLKLGRAQGVAMAAALTRGLPVFEYAPRRVKQAITGNGAASKEQVAALLKTMLKVEYSLKKLDATDGLAVALCHHFETSRPLGRAVSGDAAVRRGAKSKSASWESFIAMNPEREMKSKRTKEGNEKEK